MRKKVFFCLAAIIFSINISVTYAQTVRIIMQTSAGDIGLELYPEKAPVTVRNFLKYVDGGYYGGGRFYRVVRADNQVQNKIKIGVIQGGMGRDVRDFPFAPIPLETTGNTGILHKDGVISMARDKPGSATSEFFICVQDQPDLDFGGMRNPDGQGFAAFGKVISGMNIVRKIQNMATDQPKGNKLKFSSGQILSNPVIITHTKRLTE
ncbi:MAG: peptidylprolyl isomerase [Alphaproteobacteria bacterium]|nr:MAG: peptidylprolyl isomerase [Alphaproteobacteria bacterium]